MGEEPSRLVWHYRSEEEFVCKEEVDLPRKEPDVLVARLKHRALYTRLPDGEIRAVKTVKDSVTPPGH